jgi:hypothetical protein
MIVLLTDAHQHNLMDDCMTHANIPSLSLVIRHDTNLCSIVRKRKKKVIVKC